MTPHPTSFVDPRHEHTASISAGRSPKGWIAAALACPRRPANPFAWMQGRRALDLALGSLEFAG